MASIQTFSNEALLEETKKLVEQERLITLQLLDCLKEIETRMLFAEMGFSSLWEFCIRYLGLSEGSAQRRISAMRLNRQLPEAKNAISNGKLTLSNAAKLESFFRLEKKEERAKSTQQKKEILEQIKGLSQLECDRKLFQISPQFEISQKELLKPISADQNLLKLILDSKVVHQLNLLKSRLAHQLPNASYTDLVKFLIEDKLVQIEKRMLTPEKSHSKTNRPRVSSTKIIPKRKNIPIHIRRTLWKRSGGHCEYKSADGRICGSPHFLEIDHIQSVAHGGTNELENLRFVCRIHNGLFAKEAFGAEFMSQFMPKLS